MSATAAISDSSSAGTVELMHGLAESASTISGNSPLLLDDPTMAWFVASGHVEVFATPLEGREPIGVRSHYVSADTSSLLFGMSSEGLGHGFLAVGSPGTSLLAIPM